jgi:MoxR-like ATPase
MSDLIKKYNVDSLGIIGLKNEFKLCHIPFLVVNDVLGILCLVGSSGTGKTTLIKRLGRLNEMATGGRVGVFSADKARYEDFIGCPIPDEETNEMKIYPMPNSVSQMEMILIDEINRASYENQEKWLSLCATREIDGLPTSCKYIYAAMNPLMSEGTDRYEGVQPLDKAMGERVMGLVDIPAFSKLPTEARKAIMRASFQQVKWEPTDELVVAHIQYIKRAREIYEEVKNDYAPAVADYVDSIQADLKKETKNAVTVEARRAQFMLTNILATYALDKTENVGTIETSALNALYCSFPNALWEQLVAKPALKMAHEKASPLLKVSAAARKSSAANFEGIDKPLLEIKQLLSKENKPTREGISKVINQNIPDENEDPISYYSYACGIYKALMSDVPANGKQNVMKEQEFSRIQKIYNKIATTDRYKYYTELNDQTTNNQGKLPVGTKPPVFIATDSSPEADQIFTQLLTIPPGVCTLVIAEQPNIVVENAGQAVMVAEKIMKVMMLMKEVKDFVKAEQIV